MKDLRKREGERERERERERASRSIAYQFKVLPSNKDAGGDKELRTACVGVGLVPGRGASLPIPL